MFAKTFSFWRRLVHTAPSTNVSPSATAHENRRLWVRYSADLDAQVQLPPQNGSRRVPVHVRDISLGGASLETGQRFQCGQMVTLELPTQANQTRTVLACVVRCQAVSQDSWTVGCVFSRELSSADLESFGAKRVEHEAEDQRRWQRFDCRIHAEYQVVGGDPDMPPAPAEVLNISASGIGLQVSEPLLAGSLINLDLCDQLGKPVRSILACIVHTTTRSSGESAIGCNFIRELTEDELKSLL
jgi:c-di-GMP-binding flagellar brake protein YcgR